MRRCSSASRWLTRLVRLPLFSGLVALPTLAVAFAYGCADSDKAATEPDDDASLRRDGAPAEALDGSSLDDAAAAPPPSCERYCATVTASCEGSSAQYASVEECMAFCEHFQQGKSGETDTNTLACRQYYAGSPSMTDALAYCLAAGPFGGGVCGDRCTAFCQLTQAVCGVGEPLSPYASMPECATACAGFELRDAGADGGGEGPDGPDAGDSLNCRFKALRAALTDRSACSDLADDSARCKDPTGPHQPNERDASPP